MLPSSESSSLPFTVKEKDGFGSTSDVKMDTDVAMAVQAVDLESVHLYLDILRLRRRKEGPLRCRATPW
jgi:hypothetical protein